MKKYLSRFFSLTTLSVNEKINKRFDFINEVNNDRVKKSFFNFVR